MWRAWSLLRSLEIDAEVGRLLPLFSCRNYHIPCRVLTEKEVTILSGLEGHWTRTNTEDAQQLPEDLMRSMCGNSFHPDLIGSALGSNEILKQWISMPPGDTPPYVANRETAHEIFSDLVNKVRTQINNMISSCSRASKIAVDPTLPVFESPEPIPDDFQQPVIHPASLGPRAVVKLTKRDQYKLFCIEAAAQSLEPEVSRALKIAGQEDVFDALRAPVSISFCFESLVEALWGQHPSCFSQLRTSAQVPCLALLSKFQKAFCNYEHCRSGAAVVAVLLSMTELKSKSYWPVGFITIFGNLSTPFVAYVGDQKPKLTFLVKCLNPSQPEIFVVSATAYNQELLLNDTPHIFSQHWPGSDTCGITNFCVECRDGQWITSVWGFHCKQLGCHACVLKKMGQISSCPWHPGKDESSNQIVPNACHFCCYKNPATSVVTVSGYMEQNSNCFSLSIFHIITEEQSSLLGDMIRHLQVPIEIFTSTLSEHFISSDELARIAAPFHGDGLLDDMYRHFFLQGGGPTQNIEQWLHRRSLE